MSVKDDVLIDLIGDGDDVVLDAQGGDLSELLLREDLACRSTRDISSNMDC